MTAPAELAVFTGRKRLNGVDCGRRLVIEGVVRSARNRLLVLNPTYTIAEWPIRVALAPLE